MPGKKGLSFELSEIAGILTLPANNIAAQYDFEYDNDPQLDLVVYYRGDVKKGKAYLREIEDFRNSHRRPRWSFYILNN